MNEGVLLKRQEVSFFPINMMYKGYICYLVRVRDIDLNTSTLLSTVVVNKFLDVFHEDLPGWLLE